MLKRDHRKTGMPKEDHREAGLLKMNMRKAGMPKMEKKALEWAERHMYQLAVLLVCLIALYMRRSAVWWNSPDVGYYFDRHGNHTQSSFYYVLVTLAQYLPMLPLHGMKWFYILADFAVAFFGAAAMGGGWKKLSLKKTLFLIVFLLSPVAYLRGSVWAQPDAAAFCLLLAAYLLWDRGWRKRALIPAVLGVALYPCFLLLVAGYLWCTDNRDRGKTWVCLAVVSAGVLAVQGLCSVISGDIWQEGVRTCFRWMAYDPRGGTLYKQSGLDWFLQMVNVCGYGASMTGVLLAFKKKIPYFAALGIHLAVLLVYGSLLFPAA